MVSLVWLGDLQYHTALYAVVDWCVMVHWYGGEAQGGSKFHLITTQASAQPI